LGIQTLARELALRGLYQHDVLGGIPEPQRRALCRENAQADVAEVAVELIEGCIANQGTLDELISKTAENWELARMAVCDRNILRLGVYELLLRPQTPPKVAINEAIELAKKYSTENSAVFVNGVLDRIYADHVRGEPGARRAKPDPQARADLHVHSTASDGSLQPQDLPALAAGAGLKAFALTDHDSVEGVSAAAEAAAGEGVEVVPGVELTAYAPSSSGLGDLEVHISGLFVDVEDAALLSRLRELRDARVERVRQMTAKLAELGLAVDSGAVLARAAGGAVGRMHVAQEMVAQGHCTDLAEAFARYIGRGCAAYVPKQRMTPAQAIALIGQAGGCSVLCHPALSAEVEGLVEELRAQGLDALEVHSPAHTPQDEARLMDLARRQGLIVAGGSDFHGAAKPDVHIGQEAVSFVELEELRNLARRRR
jgi:transcription antitermination factor NusB